MFFFEQTFQTVLNGVAGPMGAITNIANAILLLCALFAVYEAYARGGDARMIGIAAAKFLFLGLVLSNYDSIFRSVNSALFTFRTPHVTNFPYGHVPEPVCRS